MVYSIAAAYIARPSTSTCTLGHYTGGDSAGLGVGFMYLLQV